MVESNPAFSAKENLRLLKIEFVVKLSASACFTLGDMIAVDWPESFLGTCRC